MIKCHIGGKVWNWTQDWLSGRESSFTRQYFHMVTSKKRGTAGLSFGPVLFLLYINDIDDVVSSKILKFADDTKLYRAVTNQDDIEILRSDLINLCH